MIAPPISPPGNTPKHCGNELVEDNGFVWTCEKSIHLVDEYNESTWHKARQQVWLYKKSMHTVLYWCGKYEESKLW